MKKVLFNLFTITLLIFLPHSGFSQSTSNLDIFLNLTDSCAKDILSQVPDSIKYLKVDMNFSSDYSIFKNRLIADFYKDGKNIFPDSLSSKNNLIINIAIEKVSVKYGDVYRDGFLGDFFTNRNFTFRGNYIFEGSLKTVKDFDCTYKDSVKLDDLKNLENDAYGFTKSNIPSEPFFSNFYEPAIALGAAAVAVFLFFAIRSK